MTQFTPSELDTIIWALREQWTHCNEKLQNNFLGEFEKENYRGIRNDAKRLMDKIENTYEI